MNKNFKKHRPAWFPLATFATITMSLLLIILPNLNSVLAQSCGSGGDGCGNVGGDGFNPNNGGAGNDGCSPIIIDVSGNGFHLTDAQSGVLFDIAGTGKPIQISWTEKGAANAFLCLDRNGNGRIDNGKELFGNFTAQPTSAEPNGFLALAEFDKPENGGNGDGIIDQRDAIFSSLRLWVDANHDGISQENELFTLPQLGVSSIGLKYQEARRMDRFGNQFRFRDRINVTTEQDNASQVDSRAYDVFLVTQ